MIYIFTGKFHILLQSLAKMHGITVEDSGTMLLTDKRVHELILMTETRLVNVRGRSKGGKGKMKSVLSLIPWVNN